MYNIINPSNIESFHNIIDTKNTKILTKGPENRTCVVKPESMCNDFRTLLPAEIRGHVQRERQKRKLSFRTMRGTDNTNAKRTTNSFYDVIMVVMWSW